MKAFGSLPTLKNSTFYHTFSKSLKIIDPQIETKITKPNTIENKPFNIDDMPLVDC